MEKKELKEVIKRKSLKKLISYLIKNNYNFLLNNEEEKATVEVYNIFTIIYYDNKLSYIIYNE